MTRFLLVLLLLGASAARGADAVPLTFYLQVVCGTDAEAPPTAKARLVGPKLDQRLHDVFRWKNYWETQRETVTLKPGGAVRRRISAQREVEIAWPTDRKMTVSLYTSGRLTRKRDQSIDSAFYIAGGDFNSTESWFVILRRDNPDASLAPVPKLVDMP